MRIRSGDHTYKWIDSWARVPDTESAKTGWAHHGVVITKSGDIISFHQADRTVLVFDTSGNLKRTWASGLTEAHGMTLVEEDGTEYIWFADNGEKRDPKIGYEYSEGQGKVTGQAVKMTLDGDAVMRLDTPGLDVYDEADYKPTWVAVNEERYGGNGDIWVTDGYSQNLVHRYDKDGVYLSSINGEEGSAGAFDGPHSIWIDRRKSEHELYIADRTNGRIQVYDLAGSFKRSFGSDFLTTPSGFASHGDLLIVAELFARLAVLDVNDNLVCYLGANREVADVEGWPNVPADRIEPGKFNSPHGIAADAEGNLYVAEWLIGGRFTKLAKT